MGASGREILGTLLRAAVLGGIVAGAAWTPSDWAAANLRSGARNAPGRGRQIEPHVGRSAAIAFVVGAAEVDVSVCDLATQRSEE